jgi:hypothetical protein
VDLVVGYDAKRFTVGNVRLGTLLTGALTPGPSVNGRGEIFGTPTVNLSTPGIVRLTVSTGASTALLPLDTTGSLVLLELTVHADAAVGPSAINLRADFRDAGTQTVTNLADATTQDLVLTPAPTNADTDAVDGLFAIVDAAGWHNAANGFDVNGDGHVTPLDALLLVQYLNTQEGGVALPAIAAPPPSYYDVNRDRAATPLDVLAVVNYLNAHGPAAREAGAAEDLAPASLAGESLELEDILSDFAADVTRQWPR